MRHKMPWLTGTILGLLVAFALAGMSVSARTTEKDGLVKTGVEDDYVKAYDYSWYQNGKKLVNAWKSVKQGGKKYKFYFGKNGIAIRAKATYDKSYNVKVVKIGRKKYGFDADSHLVAKGIYVDSKSMIWVFKKNGVYDQSSTQKLRKAFQKGAAGQSADLYERTKKQFGKPVKEETLPTCFEWGTCTKRLVYRYFEVQLAYDENLREYRLIDFFSVPVK